MYMNFPVCRQDLGVARTSGITGRTLGFQERHGLLIKRWNTSRGREVEVEVVIP
jgi:hypothetical protein